MLNRYLFQGREYNRMLTTGDIETAEHFADALNQYTPISNPVNPVNPVLFSPGLDNFRARWYGPVTGRWLSTGHRGHRDRRAFCRCPQPVHAHLQSCKSC